MQEAKRLDKTQMCLKSRGNLMKFKMGDAFEMVVACAKTQKIPGVRGNMLMEQ